MDAIPAGRPRARPVSCLTLGQHSVQNCSDLGPALKVLGLLSATIIRSAAGSPSSGSRSSP